jgi:hypothetical protein
MRQRAANCTGTTYVLTDGRSAKIRGRVKNTHAQTVEGICYVVHLLSADGNRVLDTLRYDSDAIVPAGAETALRLDVESMYSGGEVRILVEALPRRVGDRSMEPPVDRQPR